MPLLDPDSLELKLVRHTTLLLSLLLFMLHYSSLIRTKILTIIFLYVVIFRGMFHSFCTLYIPKPEHVFLLCNKLYMVIHITLLYLYLLHIIILCHLHHI